MKAMAPLWLDYQRPIPGRGRLGRLLLALGVTLTAGLLFHYTSLDTQIAEREQQLAELKRDAGRLPPADSDGPGVDTPPIFRAEINSAERWESLFVALEQAADESVTLLKLAPGTREISISGEAKNFATAADYVARLQTASSLMNTHLTGYQVIKENPSSPTRFTLLAEWRETKK